MFKIQSRIGGLLNFNFLAIRENKKYLVKFRYNEILCNRDLEIKVSSMISADPSLFNSPKCIWSCRQILISEFLENSQMVNYDMLKKSPEILGNLFLLFFWNKKH